MITTALLRSDFPEFADPVKYPDTLIGFWIGYAKLLLNQDRWDVPVPLTAMAAAIVAAGLAYVPNDILTIVGGKGPTATQLKVTTVGGGGAITGVQSTVLGDYIILPTNPAGVVGGSGNGAATFNLAPSYGVSTYFDYGLELMVAHNLVLERRAQDENSKGNVPGWGRGLINNASVDKASVGYDTANVIEEGAGHWNLTTYGTRFYRMLNMVGAGPFQVINQTDLNPLGSMFAWPGPPFSTFPNPSG